MAQKRQSSLVVLFLLFELTALLVLASDGRGNAYLYTCVPLIVFIFGGWLIVSRMRGDIALFLDAAMLLTFGAMIQCMLLKENEPPVSFIVQLILSMIVAVACGIAYKKVPAIASARGTTILFGLSVLLYVMTLLIGASAGDGVTNWIRVPGLGTVQPSEFIKVFYVLIMAGLLCTTENPSPRRVIAAVGVTFANLGFLALQGEFGTILLIVATSICLMFLFVDTKMFAMYFGFWVVCGGAGIAVVKAVYAATGGQSSNFFLRQFIKIYNRVFITADSDPNGAGYQVHQARKALLNSHFFGSETTTYMPNSSNDMVFPALTERCGLCIALAVCLLFAFLLIRGTRIYFRSKDRYHACVAAGLVCQLVLQSYIIIGGSIGVLPLTGITLPLISRGGSSLMSTCIMIALILVISTNRLWDGRRIYHTYAAKLQKKGERAVKRVSGLRNGAGNRGSGNNARRSGKP